MDLDSIWGVEPTDFLIRGRSFQEGNQFSFRHIKFKMPYQTCRQECQGGHWIWESGVEGRGPGWSSKFGNQQHLSGI